MAYRTRRRATRARSSYNRRAPVRSRSRRAPARRSTRRVSRSSGSRTVRVVIQTVAASPSTPGMAQAVPLKAMF